MGLSCVSAVLGAGRDALSALTVASASGPQVNVSLGVYKQQATEGASSFYGEFPKEEEQSLPQREFYSRPQNKCYLAYRCDLRCQCREVKQ